MASLVSVIIPVYNTGYLLNACLQSIVSQTYRNLEIIIIDDGSTDNSIKIAKKYAKSDSRINIISNSNHGVSYSRNCGIDHATGEYILFIDSDDIVNDHYIEKMIKAATLYSDSLVVCRFKSITEIETDTVGASYGPMKTGILKNDFYKLSSLNGLLYGPVVKLYSLSIIRDFNIRFDEEMTNGEDQIFNFSYYSHIKQYCFIDEELYFYRTRKNSLSRSKTRKSLNDLYLARDALIKFLTINKVPNSKEIVAAHCMTDLIDFISVENDGYKGYKYRVKKVKKCLESGLANHGLKGKTLRYLLHHSIIFPIYFFYKLKYK